MATQQGSNVQFWQPLTQIGGMAQPLYERQQPFQTPTSSSPMPQISTPERQNVMSYPLSSDPSELQQQSSSTLMSRKTLENWYSSTANSQTSQAQPKTRAAILYLIETCLEDLLITPNDLEEIVARHYPQPSVSTIQPHPIISNREPDVFGRAFPGPTAVVTLATPQSPPAPSVQSTSSKRSNSSPAEKRWVGFVKCYGKRDGYGFITCSQLKGLYQNQDVFLHHIQVAELGKSLRRGDHVEFTIEENGNKQPQARNLRLLNTNVNGEILISVE